MAGRASNLSPEVQIVSLNSGDTAHWMCYEHSSSVKDCNSQ